MQHLYFGKDFVGGGSVDTVNQHVAFLARSSEINSTFSFATQGLKQTLYASSSKAIVSKMKTRLPGRNCHNPKKLQRRIRA
jgi:hypothetical protein